MNDVELTLVFMASKTAGADEPDLTERAKKCMRAALSHFMVSDENKQFSGAVAALHALSSPDEQARIEKTTRLLRALDAACDGVPVDVGAMLDDDDRVEGFPLAKLWDEVKEEKRR
jgi:hypothetical protein